MRGPSDLEHGLLHLDAVGAWKLEVGGHLHFEREGEGLAARDLGLLAALGQRGLAHGTQLVLLDRLGVGLAQQLRAGLLQQRLAEALLQQAARGLALAEAGQLRLVGQVAEAGLQARVHGLGRHGDGDALAGGACVFDLDFGADLCGGVAHGCSRC